MALGILLYGLRNASSHCWLRDPTLQRHPPKFHTAVTRQFLYSSQTYSVDFVRRWSNIMPCCAVRHTKNLLESTNRSTDRSIDHCIHDNHIFARNHSSRVETVSVSDENCKRSRSSIKTTGKISTNQTGHSSNQLQHRRAIWAVSSSLAALVRGSVSILHLHHNGVLP